MRRINTMIKKVAVRARQFALIGALVGGVSMVSYASATVEKAGPTLAKVEAAKLQTVQQSLDAVVAALTKADPEWVKGLPVVEKVKAPVQSDSRQPLTYDWYYHGDDDPENFNKREYWLQTENPEYSCGGTAGIPCSITNSPYSNINDLDTNVLQPNPEQDIFSVASEADYAQ